MDPSWDLQGRMGRRRLHVSDLFRLGGSVERPFCRADRRQVQNYRLVQKQGILKPKNVNFQQKNRDVDTFFGFFGYPTFKSMKVGGCSSQTSPDLPGVP